MRILPLSLLLAACDQGILNPGGGGGDGGDTAVTDDAPNLSISETEVDFGYLQQGERVVHLITVSNTGTADLMVSTIAVDSPFQVNPLSLPLSAGSTSQLTLTVELTDYAEYTSNLVLTSDDPDLPEAVIPVHAATVTDGDGDGHDLLEAGGDDCDDENVAVHPDAYETWYDGIDENCDGLSDYDQDGDGYESDAFNEEASTGGGDCQDSDAAYYPDAPDEPYDNRDTNCDGADDYDYDGDGSRSEDYGKGLDCDDNDADVNTSGDEQWNGKDDDCDDETDVAASFAASEYIYTGRGTYDRAGYSMAIGDLDGDGMAELIVGAPYYGATGANQNSKGAVAIFEGGTSLPESGDVRDSDQLMDGAGSSDDLGYAVTVLRDWDGDGLGDLAVSAYGISSYSGAVYVISGSDVLSGRDTSDARASYTGSNGYYLGRGLGTNLDLDGDGLDEMAAFYLEGSTNSIALDYGGGTGSMGLAAMDARWSTSSSHENFYRNAPVGGDFDGDGYDDLIVSDGESDVGATDGGAIWCVWGSNSRYSGSTSLTSVASTIGMGTTSSDGFGWATQLGPDWDGDADDELWVYDADEAMYVFEGGVGRGVLSESDAVVSYAWGTQGDAGRIRQVGDFTGDNINDMAVFFSDSSLGYVEMFYSEYQTGSYSETDDFAASVKGTSDGSNGDAGFGMAPIGADIDGDGDWDYAAGDPSWSDSSEGQGAGYVFMNEHLE